MIGDNTDMFGRLKNLLPVGWFGDDNPIRDALLWGYANVLAWGYTLYLYAQSQTRIKSATDGWLDLIGLDFFGDNLIRYANQTDASYRNRILINIFRERTTRPAMEKVLYDLTGRWPVIIEPARPADVGSYGASVLVQRASIGTYFGLNGLMTTAAPNEPRYDTNPITGKATLLVEPAKTNLLTYSALLSNAAWIKTNVTVTASASTAPDGKLSAFRVGGGGVVGSSYVYRAAWSWVAGTTYSVSAFAKADDSNQFSLSLSPVGFVTNRVATFTLVGDGSFSVTGGGTATIQNVGGGWYRCTLTAMATATGSGNWIILSNPNASGSTVGCSVWGIQLETDSPTSYIATDAAQFTRAAESQYTNMPAGSIGIGGYSVAGAYGSILLPYQAFITAFRPMGQGLPFVSGYGISTGAYSTPSRSAYGQLSGGDVTDEDIYAAIDATKPIGTVAWTRISS